MYPCPDKVAGGAFSMHARDLVGRCVTPDIIGDIHAVADGIDDKMSHDRAIYGLVFLAYHHVPGRVRAAGGHGDVVLPVVGLVKIKKLVAVRSVLRELLRLGNASEYQGCQDNDCKG